MWKLREWIDPKMLTNMLSSNPRAGAYLEQNPEKIEWNNFSKNPAIFEYDYANMIRPFTEELMQNRFHPDNLGKFEEWGF